MDGLIVVLSPDSAVESLGVEPLFEGKACAMERMRLRLTERSGTSRTKVLVHGLQYVTGDFAGAFIDLCEERRVVDDVPDAVTDFFEADEFVAERRAEKWCVLFEAKRAGAANGLDVHMPGILRRPDAFGIGTGRGMKAIGARLARAVNRIAGRTGRVLADRYHHRLLPTPKEVRHALRYVLLNARRHASKARASLARTVKLDPASSARWFDGWKRGHITHAEEPGADGRPAVARARTWLLTVGWRRYGLLDPADVPGGR